MSNDHNLYLNHGFGLINDICRFNLGKTLVISSLILIPSLVLISFLANEKSSNSMLTDQASSNHQYWLEGPRYI